MRLTHKASPLCENNTKRGQNHRLLVEDKDEQHWFIDLYACTATEAASPTSARRGGGGGGGGTDAGAMYNGGGRPFSRDVRNTDTAAAGAGAAGGGGSVGASSSELSELDNEPGFNRSSADYNKPGSSCIQHISRSAEQYVVHASRPLGHFALNNINI